MKKFLKLWVLVMAVIMSLSLCACNIRLDDQTKGKEEEPLHVNEGATKTITVKVLTTPLYEYQTMVRWANAYMKQNADTQIMVTNDMSSMNILAQWDAANKLPDIVWTAGDQHSYYSSIGYFIDFRTLIGGENEGFFDDFYPTIMDSTHFRDNDKGIWFMPRDYNQLAVLCNTEMFNEAKIDVPAADWTWSQFEEICKKFREFNTVKKFYPIEMSYSWNPLSVTLLANEGASVYKDGKLNMKTPEAKKCLDYLYDFVKVKNYAPAISSGGFEGKFSPMMISVRPNLPTAVAANIKLKVLPFPTNENAPNGMGYVGTGCSGYAITKACNKEKQKDAFEFLKFCVSEEGYEAVGSLGTIVPARMTLADKGSWTTYTDKFGTVIDTKSFTDTLAEPMDVNFCNNLAPQYHGATRSALQSFFMSVSVQNYEFDSAVTEFLNSVSMFN